ncbi:MAG: ISL3 family transposase, partial [Chlamydiae bacterium]|nr:ISL3 family transposase [Chlamydiota bacterium]
MSTSNLYHTHGIKGVEYKSTKYEKGATFYSVEMVRKGILCPKCGSQNFQFKGQKTRRFKMNPAGPKKCYLDVVLHRVKCSECNYQWWPRLPFMKGKFQMTRSLIQYAFDLLSACTIQDVSRILGISWNVIKKIHKMKLEKLYKKIDLKDIKHISVDEFAIKKGHEYMTVFSDIESGRIIHAVEGRKLEDITPFLLKLKKEAKNLEAIAMDMSVPYISAVKKILPEIDIVFDHFHVDALMNKALDEIRKEQQQTLNQKEKKVL